jgi:Cu2+-containing amine oxidase
VRNAICIHEEDAGILWKHTDIFNGSAQSPVARCGFTLKPTGFFHRNPTLDVPPPPHHC